MKALIFSLLVAFTAGSAQTQDFRETVGPWSIRSAEGVCFLATQYPDKTVFMFRRGPKGDTLSIHNASWSYPDAEKVISVALTREDLTIDSVPAIALFSGDAIDTSALPSDFTGVYDAAKSLILVADNTVSVMYPVTPFNGAYEAYLRCIAAVRKR